MACKLPKASFKYGDLRNADRVHVVHVLFLINNSSERTRATRSAHLTHHAMEDDLRFVLPCSKIVGSCALEVGGGDVKRSLDVTADVVVVTNIDNNRWVGGAKLIEEVGRGNIGYCGHGLELGTRRGVRSDGEGRRVCGGSGAQEKSHCVCCSNIHWPFKRLR